MKSENPYASLERIFHEPNRLAIMSALCNTAHGLTFNELKETCQLTDGNLNRHLKTLEDAKAIRIEKTFERSRPKTTIYLSDSGRDHFLEYLKALEEVLRKAAVALAPGTAHPSIRSSIFGKTARA